MCIRFEDFSKIRLFYLVYLFSLDSVSRLFAIIECVPWDMEPAAGSSPEFVTDVCRLGGMHGMSWRRKCSPVKEGLQGCGVAKCSSV